MIHILIRKVVFSVSIREYVINNLRYEMKNCSVEGCDGNYYSKGYCSKHYMQIKLYEKILERTKFDPNEFIIERD
jgi:hypothetical protein